MLLTRRAGLCGMAGGSVALLLGGSVAAQQVTDLETIRPGRLRVAFTGDMPGTGWIGSPR